MTQDRRPKLLQMPGRNTQPDRKTVACSQAAVDALPLNSGDWVVEGIPGLIVRCGAHSRSFRLQRRVRGKLVKRVLGEMSVAAARREAMKQWARLKPAPPNGQITLAEAWRQYLEEKPLAAKTKLIYSDNLERYLGDWKDCSLESLGQDRAGFRARILKIARDHGAASSASTYRNFRAVYNYHRRVNPDLPECPTTAVDQPRVGSRDWAMSDDDLRQWWAAVLKLNPLKRTLWLTLLLTGARRGSVEALRWTDVDFEKGVVRFSTAKAGRTYAVPMPDRLKAILIEYREKWTAPDEEWVFPSRHKPGEHIVCARDDKRGVPGAHHLRHTMRTRLAEAGATPDLARVALGHSLTGDVSRGYITPALLVEAVRPLMNAVAERYAEILGWHVTTEQKTYAGGIEESRRRAPDS